MMIEVINAGGNVGASQATKLGDYFSLMMLVEVPDDSIASLTDKLQNMKDLSASVSLVKGDASPSSPPSYTIGYQGALTLEGADDQGIIHKVTKILSANGLNIDKLETSDELAPGGSTVLFKMKGITHAYEPLAAGFDPSKIQEELAALGDDLNCDIDLTDITSPPAGKVNGAKDFQKVHPPKFKKN